MSGGQNSHVRTPLERISRYVSTFRSQRCVDAAGRDSCRLQLYAQDCLHNVVAKTTMNNFRHVLRNLTPFSGDSLKPIPFCSSAATLARFFHVEIFKLVDESNNQVRMSYRMLCVVGSEMNSSPS